MLSGVQALSVASIVPLVIYLGYQVHSLMSKHGLQDTVLLSRRRALMVQCCMQGDFPDVNPLLPFHYFKLARRCFAAMANPENNGKVRRDLGLICKSMPQES